MTITPSSRPKQKNRAAERCYIAARARSAETRWNKNAVSHSLPECWLIFFARSERKSEADSLIGPRISTKLLLLLLTSAVNAKRS